MNFSVKDAAAILDRQKWTFAKRYAKLCPHWWTNKHKWDDPKDYEKVVECILENGDPDRWRKCPERMYLRPGDGYEYWVMVGWKDRHESYILNRGKWPRDY